MIKYIVLDQETATDFSLPLKDRIIGELGRFNVFVGTNNSGKSRLLRRLFISAYDSTRSNNVNIKFFDDSNDSLIDLKGLFSRWIYKGESRNFILHNSYQHHKEIFEKNILFDLGIIMDFMKNIDIIQPANNQFLGIDFGNIQSYSLHRGFGDHQEEIFSEIKDIRRKLELNSIYLPILRGLRPIQRLNNKFDNTDSFALRTKFDYPDIFSQAPVFSGLSIYEDIKRLLLGTEEDRTLISDFEVFLQKNIFLEKVTLIPKHDKDVLNIKIGNKPQLEIYNLGDGLQTIITVLFPIFIGKDSERLIFIEEPEVHLHPLWQSKLLRALKQIPNQQYFITTHSNVLINDPETKLFFVKQENESMSVKNIKLDTDKLLLIQELGYKQSDLLQANYILWVEGPSDKIYLKYWLEKLAPHLVEGINYVILFFGGSSYKHLLHESEVLDLSFIKTINQNFGIVLDSDKDSKKALLKKDKKNIEKHFVENNLFCWITEYREIENYISLDDFIDAVKVVHKRKSVKIDEGCYIDRNKVLDETKKAEYKSTIKLPQDLFSKIQQNANGKTTGITDEDLRMAVEIALNESVKNTFNVDKNKVAQHYISTNPEVPNDDELLKRLNELISCIEKANLLFGQN